MKKQKLKIRNLLAIQAWNMSGAGKHKDRKKENSKRACRGKVSLNE